MALGSGQATPLQMATAYSTFANGGHRIQPYFIAQIYDFNNKLLYQANPAQACAICFNKSLDKLNEDLIKQYREPSETDEKDAVKLLSLTDEDNQTDKPTPEKEQDESTEKNESSSKMTEQQAELIVYNASPQADRLSPPAVQYSPAEQAPRILSPTVAYDMAGILRDVVQRGTAVRAKALKRDDIGGKTGTTNDTKDAWFAGFHPSLVTIVWVGFDTPSTLGRHEYGGTAALPIWMDFMRTQLKDLPHQWVSVNNQAKSKKQKQEVIDITEDGEKVVKSSDKSEALVPLVDHNLKPPKTTAKKRQVPKEAKPTSSPKQQSPRPSSNSDTATASKPASPARSTPLTVKSVDELPPL